jgi:hypothetical protein
LESKSLKLKKETAIKIFFVVLKKTKEEKKSPKLFIKKLHKSSSSCLSKLNFCLPVLKALFFFLISLQLCAGRWKGGDGGFKFSLKGLSEQEQKGC